MKFASKLITIVFCRIILIPLAFVFICIPNFVVMVFYEWFSILLIMCIGQNNITVQSIFEGDRTELDRKFGNLGFSFRILKGLAYPFGKEWWKDDTND